MWFEGAPWYEEHGELHGRKVPGPDAKAARGRSKIRVFTSGMANGAPLGASRELYPFVLDCKSKTCSCEKRLHLKAGLEQAKEMLASGLESKSRSAQMRRVQVLTEKLKSL